MDQIIKQLKKIGLGDYESMIYANLTASSPSNATSLAKKCNLSRSSVYTTLNSLIAKGLVGVTYKNDVKQFVVEDDKALDQLLAKEKDELEEKVKSLSGIKKGFEAFKNISLNIPHIVFFEGQEGLKKIYLSMMRQASQGSTLYLMRDEFIWQPDWSFVFKKDWHTRVQKIKKEKNIKTKLLVNNSKQEKDKKDLYGSKKNLDVRFLSRTKMLDRFAVYIIDDTVSILSMEHNNLVGVKITNQHMAENFKNVFCGLWKV